MQISAAMNETRRREKFYGNIETCGGIIVLSCGRVTGGLLGSGGAILGLINQSRLKYVRRQN
jgi:hypothetical protein